MIKKLVIKNYNCLAEENFDFGSLNILTGVNSSGKSSVIQALLLISHCCGGKEFLTPIELAPEELKNKNSEGRDFSLELDDWKLKWDIAEKEPKKNSGTTLVQINKDIYHVAANRPGPQNLYLLSNQGNIIGRNGEYIFSYYEHNKDTRIEAIVNDAESETLKANVDYWLSFILGEATSLSSEKVDANTLKLSYKYGDIDGISPLHLGAGVTYLAQVLIVCLMAKKGTTVLIEGPEIHLHPGAQSRLGKFLAFIANSGAQIIVETHCEHLTNRIRFEGYKENIQEQDVNIYYKFALKEPFIKVGLKNGHFVDSEYKKIKFPKGFFDATLSELLEIG